MMKTLNELYEQFNKEETHYRGYMEKLKSLHSDAMERCKNSESFEDRMNEIDLGIEICQQMSKSDTEHKKFLLKWSRKIKRKIFFDALLNRKGE